MENDPQTQITQAGKALGATGYLQIGSIAVIVLFGWEARGFLSDIESGLKQNTDAIVQLDTRVGSVEANLENRDKKIDDLSAKIKDFEARLAKLEEP